MSAQQHSQMLGKVVQQDFSNENLLERLLRYEGRIECHLYRALTELQKFQFIRTRNNAIDADNVDEASVLHNNDQNILPNDAAVGCAAPLHTQINTQLPPNTPNPNKPISSVAEASPLWNDNQSSESISAKSVKSVVPAPNPNKPISQARNVNDGIYPSLTLPTDKIEVLHENDQTNPNDETGGTAKLSLTVDLKDGQSGITTSNGHQACGEHSRTKSPAAGEGPVDSLPSKNDAKSADSVVPAPNPNKPILQAPIVSDGIEVLHKDNTKIHSG